MFELISLAILLFPVAALACLTVAPERYRPLGYRMLVAFGALLLVGPGGCALFSLMASGLEFAQRGRMPDYFEAVLLIAGLSLVIALGGFFLARFALRRLRPTP